MTIVSSYEFPIDKRIDVILTWLEKDIKESLWKQRFDFANLRISFHAHRKGNAIEITSRLLVNEENKTYEGELVARYEISRVTDIADDETYNCSILKFTWDTEHLEYEKIAYLYLARLGIALKTGWADAVNKTLEEIQTEIEKKQGWHWGWSEKVREAAGIQFQVYGHIPNEPKPAQDTQVAQHPIQERNTVQAGAGKTKKSSQIKYDKMKENTKVHFREAYQIYLTMCDEYKGDVLDGASQKARPTIQDFRARVIREMNWDVGDRRLRDVISCGDANLIK